MASSKGWALLVDALGPPDAGSSPPGARLAPALQFSQGAKALAPIFL